MVPRLLIAIALVALFVACGGDDDSDSDSIDQPAATEAPETATSEATSSADGEPAAVVVVTNELAVGENRFTFGLLDANNQPVDGLSGTLTVFSDPQGTPTEMGTEPFEFLAIEFPDEEDPPDVNGIYKAQLAFDQTALYGIQVNVEGRQQVPQGLRILVEVLPEARGVQVGDPAPPSDTPTVDEVEDLKTIDSDDPPNPQLHEQSIAEALATGRPTVVIFATPAFCTSRLCGPMIDVILSVYPQYSYRINFIHVEPFVLDADGQVVTEGERFVDSPTYMEWQLATEPVTFVIAADGTVAFRFDGITTQDEISAALDAVLA
jgi:hypothetical protein